MKLSLARNYRGGPPAALRRAAEVGEPCYLGPAEIEALAVGTRVRIKRYQLVHDAEVVKLWPIPPLRDGRRIVHDVKGRRTPDVGSRRVEVRYVVRGRNRAIGRVRVVEVRARDLIRAVQS